MSLKNVYLQIQEIADTSSTLEKIAILSVYLKKGIFRKVVWLTYTYDLKFKVNKFPAYSQKRFSAFQYKGSESIFDQLKMLALQKGASSSDKERLIALSSVDKETYELVKLICMKDLNCGINVKSINKARPQTIKHYAYQRCRTSKHIDNIIYTPNAIAQVKADGTFVNVFIYSNLKIVFRTRKGKIINQLDKLIAKMIDQPPSSPKLTSRRGLKWQRDNRVPSLANTVYLGELRVYEKDMKTIMSRKKGNGYITQCQHGTCDPEIASRIFLTLWDAIPIPRFEEEHYDTVYNDRMYEAIKLVQTVDDKQYVRMIEGERVSSKEEAYAFYRKARASGQEGAIIKNLKGIWQDDQNGSPDMIKLKHSFECELKVVGWKKGSVGSKWENSVGSILCESSCGKLKVAISGLTDEERGYDWDLIEDSIITVEAESVITSKSKGKGVFSLYTPSFIEIREDRHTADSLERIIEIEKESKKMSRRKA